MRIDEVESAVRAVCEPIFDRPLKEISFVLVLLRLFEVARQFEMEVQPQLVLLQKTLLAIEGLGRQLYPELDLWTTAKPILESWMRERSSPLAHIKRLIADWPEISDDLIALPGLVHGLIREREREQREPPRAEGRQFLRQARAWRRCFAAAVFLIAAVLWLGLGIEPAAVGWIGATLGGLVLLLAAWRG
jgi:ubiquinone biosynthesis protein